MKNLILNSLFAMLISWIVALIILVIVEGTGGGFSDIAGLFFMGIIFTGIAWLLFIFPLLKLFSKILSKNGPFQVLFPFLTAIYGFLVFVLIFAGINGDLRMIAEFFQGPSTIGLTSAGVGFVWGMLFVILNKSSFKRVVG